MKRGAALAVARGFDALLLFSGDLEKAAVLAIGGQLHAGR
jgi:hypothetical protein